MSASVLCNRDTNIPTAPTISGKGSQKTMELHRQHLEAKLRNKDEPQAYVSPSDGIMSPATQKLNAFKSKHAMKRAKPQTLFAKTSSRNIEAARNSNEPMFADIKPRKEELSTEEIKS